MESPNPNPEANSANANSVNANSVNAKANSNANVNANANPNANPNPNPNAKAVATGTVTGTTTGTGMGNGGAREEGGCAGCNRLLPRSKYSNKQWKKENGRKRCKDCVETEMKAKAQKTAEKRKLYQQQACPCVKS